MNKRRCITTFIFITIGLLLLIIWNMGSGSLDVSYKSVFSCLTGTCSDDVIYNIVMNIRMPRLVAAVLLGGALSVSGFLLQTFFCNPIAGPFVLGISQGAKLAVAIAMIIMMSNGVNIGSIGMVTAAFIGSLIAMGFVLLVSIKVKNMSILIVCGIMIGYICSAITDILVTFANDSNIINLHNWSLGSFSGTDWKEVTIMFVIIVIALAFAFFMSKPIGAYQMGEVYASNMGVNIKVLRVVLILLSSLLAATVTAFAGPVSFVGIAVPHLIKLSMGTAKPIVMIPGCFIGGAALTVLCDGIARTLFAPTELSISTVTSVILVPVVIGMMIGRKKGGTN